MADLGLYVLYLEHARITQGVLHRRRSQRLRESSLAFEMLDGEFLGLYRVIKSICRDLIQELEPYLPNDRGGSIKTVSRVCDSDLNITSIDASHGGADHDSFIWSRHPLRIH